MFHASIRGRDELAGLLGQLAQISSRPRYAFMMLSLLAEVADARGVAGPWVRSKDMPMLLRDWLCDALAQMAARDPKRLALTRRVEDALRDAGQLPDDAQAARAIIEEEVRLRIRASGKTNVSRAVSELVEAGLLRRHYQGYRVDHHNRGAQRQAVYTLAGNARLLLSRRVTPAPVEVVRQGELFPA